MVSYVLAGIFGKGGRGFFSPDTLETKTQSEWLLPLIHVPLYRSSFSYSRDKLVDYLVQEGYWKPAVETGTPRWILSFQWNQLWRDGESFLHRELAWRSAEWMDWSRENPRIAERLWPGVLDALRTPDGPNERRAEILLRHAQMAPSLKEFEERLFKLDGITLNSARSPSTPPRGRLDGGSDKQ